jgi:hypothetical protein
MEETVIFDHTIVIGFSDLTNNLQDRIFSKISEQEFFNTPYEVCNITSFEIKEMLVSGSAVVCKVVITATANYPKVGSVFTISEYAIKNNNIVYIHKPSGRIIINARLPEGVTVTAGQPVKISIEDCKRMAKNILCVAKVMPEH